MAKAINAGWIDYRSMELDPRFDSMRSTPALVSSLNRLRATIQGLKKRVEQPNR